ncbi:hypothetical protein, variant [Cladophialophora immunda]|nr:hypothetical protein, variant [Cladophialophora immunda]KIW22013.1 hypothetical protein, variant [Cladophialophora immunda]
MSYLLERMTARSQSSQFPLSEDRKTLSSLDSFHSEEDSSSGRETLSSLGPDSSYDPSSDGDSLDGDEDSSSDCETLSSLSPDSSYEDSSSDGDSLYGDEDSTAKPTVSPRPSPSAVSASYLLFAPCSTIVCVHRDTLSVKRHLNEHHNNIELILTDGSVSERAFSCDVGRIGILWNLLTGKAILQYEFSVSVQVGHWMMNDGIIFGNRSGDIILFEPSTRKSKIINTRKGSITAIAASPDSRKCAVAYKTGSIVLAELRGSSIYLHVVETSSPPVSLAWHPTSRKNKKDRLAFQLAGGKLSILSIPRVSKSATTQAAWSTRQVSGSITEGPGQILIAWSKKGKISQFCEDRVMVWDVRKRRVTGEQIQTGDGVIAIAAHGPTSTIYTLGRDDLVRQYDAETCQMVARSQPLKLWSDRKDCCDQ